MNIRSSSRKCNPSQGRFKRHSAGTAVTDHALIPLHLTQGTGNRLQSPGRGLCLGCCQRGNASLGRMRMSPFDYGRYAPRVATSQNLTTCRALGGPAFFPAAMGVKSHADEYLFIYMAPRAVIGHGGASVTDAAQIRAPVANSAEQRLYSVSGRLCLHRYPTGNASQAVWNCPLLHTAATLPCVATSQNLTTCRAVAARSFFWP